MPSSASAPQATEPAASAGTPRNDDLRSTIRRLYVDERRSMNEVGELVGRSSERVRQLLRKMGIPVRPRSECSRLAFASGRAEPDHPAFGPTDEPLMAAAYERGESIKELARQHHSSSATVRAMLVKHGVTLRPRDTQGAQARARIAAARRPASERRAQDQQGRIGETVAAYYATASGSKVASILQRDSLWVYSALRGAGVAIGKNASARRICLDDQAMRAAYEAGQGLSALARTCGVSNAAVVHAIVRAGWTLRDLLIREGLPTAVNGISLDAPFPRGARSALSVQARDGHHPAS